MKGIAQSPIARPGGKSHFHAVKTTALLYLREALLKEEYERCAEITRVAREFGASDREIAQLLEDPRRAPD